MRNLTFVALSNEEMKIAFVSCTDHASHSEGYLDEESMLMDFLRKKGIDIERQVWNDASVDWKHYNLAILKSPWDYHEHINEFYAWLDKLQKLNVKLLNPIDIVRWNADKHYLKDIADAGLKIIPTLFLEKDTKPELALFFEQLKTEKLIVKPCVSAGARNTFFITRDNLWEHNSTLHDALKNEAYIVQPFMQEIFDGEWSFIFFNGTFSHSLLKMPLADDYRTQHYHGGTTNPATASPGQIESAAPYVQYFAKGTLYARVDGIIRNAQFHLMELELIEPYLYLETNEAANRNFYAALLQLIAQSAIGSH